MYLLSTLDGQHGWLPSKEDTPLSDTPSPSLADPSLAVDADHPMEVRQFHVSRFWCDYPR